MARDAALQYDHMYVTGEEYAMQTFSEQLSALRRERNITQEQLAQEINVSRTTISRWESGKVLPDIETVRQLSQTLGHDFFAVVNAQDAAPNDDTFDGADSGEAPAQASASPVRSRWKLWAAIAGGLCLLALGVFLLRGYAGGPKLPAQIVAKASPETASLIRLDEKSYGWRVSFTFENESDVAFTPDGVEIIFYENDMVNMKLIRTREEIRPQLTDGKLIRGAAPLMMPVQANMMSITHVTCRIYGVDDHGNMMEVTARADFVPEFASLTRLKEAAIKAAEQEPGKAHVVAAAAEDVVYLEPFDQQTYGWNSMFIFQNYSDVAFIPDGIESIFHGQDGVVATFTMPYEDLRPFMSNGMLYKGGIPLQFPIGSNQLFTTGVTCRIYGKDVNGNPVEASATVQFSQELYVPGQ